VGFFVVKGLVGGGRFVVGGYQWGGGGGFRGPGGVGGGVLKPSTGVVAKVP